ncbi:hypothetical protein [Anaerococcus prevotii]|uniref:Uncharacterized protein n=1 Tax=Anaerococcus prevotii ACS-065-V-Col13 TaxID=879305 RepID=F0GV35_9FIRM|nr:hypothetical protein [Anaerococcus prevotii]EGC82239.1 hypothetical protein HMPREF9290_1128 [Anaerococcus prevotii ACS-065-V-Col13]
MGNNKDLKNLNNEEKKLRKESKTGGYICPKCGEPLTPENDYGGICEDCYKKSENK